MRRSQPGDLRVWSTHNYPSEILDYATCAEVLSTDIAYRSILKDPARSPMRTWDDPDYECGSYGESPVARRLLLPSGFRGGMSACLMTIDGRHIGNFHMNTEKTFVPDSRQVNAFLRSFEVVAMLMEEAARQLGITGRQPITLVEGGIYTNFRGSHNTVLLQLQSAVRCHAASMNTAGQSCFFRWQSPDKQWFLVEMSTGKVGLQARASREAPPHQLTWRELEVLEYLSVGLTNGAIGIHLQISRRTVEHHVERILGKLGAPTRAAAAAVAVQEKLRLGLVNHHLSS